MTLESGMLWFCQKPVAPITPHVTEAASYYASKYGVTPTVCHCHPADATGQPERIGHVRLVKDGTVLRGHLWIGVEESK